MAREPFNRIWTETPTVDDFGEPTEAMWEEGWGGGAAAEPPEAFAQNWWQNRADFALQQIERNGAMDWLSDVPYQMWAFARGSDGTVYLAIQSNTNVDPVSDDGSNWLSIPDYIKSRLNATGTAPLFGVRAWANFDGTDFDGSGNVTVRGSGNISSIVRLSNGVYRVTMDSPMTDSSYSVSSSVAQDVGGWGVLSDSINVFNYTSSSFDIVTGTNTGEPAGQDCALISFQVVR